MAWLLQNPLLKVLGGVGPFFLKEGSDKSCRFAFHIPLLRFFERGLGKPFCKKFSPKINKKMKIFKNKFFIVCLCVAVVVAGLSSTFALMGYRALARDIVGTVAMPVRLVFAAFSNAVDGFSKYFQSVSTLEEQKEALEQENAALREQLERAALLEQENERLREYLSMKAENPDFTFELARVIGREAGNYVTVFTLNRGSVHGIEQDMPVITEDGIVGCVTEVGLTWCKVSTILESARSVGVYLPRIGATGILSGDYSMRNDGLCRLTFVDANITNSDVQAGDVVLSSGMGSVYPAELRVGTVVSVEVDPANRALVATVQPSIDFSDAGLDSMMILTGFASEQA